MPYTSLHQVAVLAHETRGQSEWLRVIRLEGDDDAGEGFIPAVIVDRHRRLDPATRARIVELARNMVRVCAAAVRILTSFSWQPEMSPALARSLSGTV